MLVSLALLSILAVVLGTITITRHREAIPGALADMRSQLVMMLTRLPLALVSAAFISLIVPTDMVGPIIGADTGWRGIFIAALFGAFIPGGPILSFPLAIVIWRAGAGEAQMVALLASWSVFAIHRVISYELPLLGPRFVMIRLTASWLLPPLAGFLTMAILALHLIH